MAPPPRGLTSSASRGSARLALLFTLTRYDARRPVPPRGTTMPDRRPRSSSDSLVLWQPIVRHVAEWRGGAVLVREGRGFEGPLYTYRWVVPQDGPVVFGGVEVGAFVGEEGVLAGYDEAVGEVG